MTDILEDAENAISGYPGRYANNRERMVALFPEIVAELSAARTEIERLKEFEWMYQELQ